jgi:hypothetical protein
MRAHQRTLASAFEWMVLEANDGSTAIAGVVREQSKHYACQLRSWLVGLRAIQRAMYINERVVDLDERTGSSGSAARGGGRLPRPSATIGSRPWAG